MANTTFATQNFPISAEDKPVVAITAVVASGYEFLNKGKVANHTKDKVAVNTAPLLGINSNQSIFAIKVTGSNTVVN